MTSIKIINKKPQIFTRRKRKAVPLSAASIALSKNEPMLNPPDALSEGGDTTPSSQREKTIPDLLKLVESLEAGKKYICMIQKTIMVSRRISHAMMVQGDVGAGKTTIITKVLISEGKIEGKDFVFIKGYSTARALYEELYKNKEAGKIIIIDDCDAALKNKTSLDILKAVLDDKYKKKVSYRTSRVTQDLPSEFTFEGSVIFLTNLRPNKNDVHFFAIQDRCLFQPLFLNPRERLEYIERIIVPTEYKGMTLEAREIVFKQLKEVVSEGVTDFTFRTYKKLLDCYRYSPNQLHLHIEELVGEQTLTTKLISIMERNVGKKSEWKSIFISETDKGARTYQYTLNSVKSLLTTERFNELRTLE